MKLFVTLIIGLVIASSAMAGERDAFYGELLAQSQTMVRVAGQDGVDWRGVRRQAVTVAGLIKNFSIDETERRAADKVAAPAGLFVRPGQTARRNSQGQPGGKAVEIDDVPNTWFNTHIMAAGTGIRTLLQGLDGGTLTADGVRRAAESVHRSITLIAMPPAS